MQKTAQIEGERSFPLDEWFDVVFCRPVGKKIAALLKHTPLHPNHVSMISVLLGIGGGICFYVGGAWPALAAVLLLMMSICDCTDGELARLRGSGGDWRGRFVDGISDLGTSFSVHLGILLTLYRQRPQLLGNTVNFFILFCYVLAAGASMGWNAAVFDDVKQRLKSSSIDRELLVNPPRLTSWRDKIMYAILHRYILQIARAPGPGRPGGQACLRRLQWVGPTHHWLAIVVTALATAFWPLAPVVYLAIAIVPCNLYLWLTLQHFRKSDAIRRQVIVRPEA